MYCPQCSVQLVDGDKFCRACGADLKTVALALAGQQLPSKAGKNKTRAPKKEKTWMEKRGEGVLKAVEGATLLGWDALDRSCLPFAQQQSGSNDYLGRNLRLDGLLGRLLAG